MLCRNHVEVSEGIRHCARCNGPFCHDCLVEMGGKPYCAACKAEELLDVRSGVDRMRLDFASVGRRFGAMFVDGVIVWVVITILNVAFTAIMVNMRTGILPVYLIWQLATMFLIVTYQATMVAYSGQTLGKKALKVKVISADGTAVSAGQAWGREIARFFLGFLCIVDYIPGFFTEQRTTLHDMAAKTRVINWI